MSEEHTSIPTADGDMDLFVARPKGEAKGAIVVVQEAFGVTSHIEDICRRLAVAGWVGVAPSYFHRLDTHFVPYDNMDAAMDLVGQLHAEGLKVDSLAAFGWCNSQGFEDPQIGMVGFCMGGSVVIYSNTLRKIGAAVTYYGGGIKKSRFGLPPLIEVVPDMQAPWLGQYGDEDKGIPVDQLEEVRLAVKALPFDTDLIIYPGAGHAFNCNDRPQSYNESAARDSWAHTLEWFGRHI